MILGTPSYLSPEMIQGARIDPRSDQFSLGTVLIEALAHKKVFAAETFEAMAGQIISKPTPSFAELGIAAPPSLEEVLQRLHQKEPDQRYGDERQLIEDLARVGREAGLDLRRAAAV
jgi:serine/threonine-protein kinase